MNLVDNTSQENKDLIGFEPNDLSKILHEKFIEENGDKLQEFFDKNENMQDFLKFEAELSNEFSKTKGEFLLNTHIKKEVEHLDTIVFFRPGMLTLRNIFKIKISDEKFLTFNFDMNHLNKITIGMN